jgi:DNA end-binding protein Ku
LRLSLVTCPVALFAATSDSEKISFNQINRNTGHRIKYMKVDADTGEEVLSEDIMKGYAVDKDTYIEVSKDELENIALESTRTIEIDEFVPKSDIDQRFAIRPYYLVPDGKVGHDAYAVIRETIRSMDMVAIGRLVLTCLPGFWNEGIPIRLFGQPDTSAPPRFLSLSGPDHGSKKMRYPLETFPQVFVF